MVHNIEKLAKTKLAQPARQLARQKSRRPLKGAQEAEIAAPSWHERKSPDDPISQHATCWGGLAKTGFFTTSLGVMSFLIKAVLALFATASTAFAYIGPPELEVGVEECVGQNLNTFRCARGIEKKMLLGQKFPIRRAGNTLIIRTATKTVRLIDNNSENGNESISYSYLGRISAIRSHIVYVQYYEGGSYMAVNEQSALAAYPSGFPVVSPNKQHFFSISEDMFAGYDPNNVEVWRVTAKTFYRAANFELEWGPRSAMWFGSRQFEVRKVCRAPTEEGADDLKPCGKARVVYSNAAWKLIE